MLMGKKYIKNIILYAGMGMLCMVNLRQLWQVMLIFFGLTAFYVWLSHRHWNDELGMTDRMKQGALDKLKQKQTEKKIRKEEYQEFMAEIEEEFSTDDWESEEDESEE